MHRASLPFLKQRRNYCSQRIFCLEHCFNTIFVILMCKAVINLVAHGKPCSRKKNICTLATAAVAMFSKTVERRSETIDAQAMFENSTLATAE